MMVRIFLSLITLITFSQISMSQTTAIWALPGGGSWNDVNSWDLQSPPNISSFAVFSTGFTSAPTITLDGNQNAGGLRFQGVSGNPITINSGTPATSILTLDNLGIDMINSLVNVSIASPITLNSAQTWETRGNAANGNRSLTTANISTNGQTLTLFANNVSGNGSQIINTGIISGSGGMIVNGASNGSGGLVNLAGTAANTFTGAVTVNGGTLLLSKTASIAGTNVIVNNGQLRIAGGITNALNTSTVLTMSGASLYNQFSVNNDGTIANSSNSFNQTYASINFGSSGSFSSGGGTTIVTGTFTGTGTGTIGINSNGVLEANQFNLSSVVTTNGGISLIGNSSTAQSVLRVGAGGIQLNGRNVNINFGTASGALGSRVELNGNVTTTGNVNFASTGTSASNTNSFVQLRSATRTFNTNAGSILNMNAFMVDGVPGSGFIKDGAGTMQVTRAATFTGAVQINNGILRLGASNVLPEAAGNTITLNGGTLSSGSTTGFNDTLADLTVTANSNISLGTGDHTLTIADINPNSLLTILNWTGTIYTTGTQGKIFSNATLSSTELQNIIFNGTFGTNINPHAFQLSSGEIVPVPEPISIMSVAFLGMTVYGLRKKAKSTNKNKEVI